jgi:DNA helicase-2/ATP-dependent DNA helicase PcrA
MSDHPKQSPAVALNPSQKEVAYSKEKHVVVLAGAGTGKTAAITHKVAHLIRSGVRRRDVMMITFTRKAAGEMQRRVGALIGDVPKQNREDAMQVGTYHAISSLLIRRDAVGFGLARSNFTTLDEDDASSLMKSAYRECGIKPAEFVAPAKVRSALSLAVNKRIALAEHFENEFLEDGERALSVVQCYRQLKKSANALDYDDLLVLWGRRLAEDEAYAAKLRSIYRHVICDEFQDNNALNYDILSRLDPEHLTVVGDVNQSIFGFRGASCGLVDLFLREHPDARVIRLENNYRSGQKILDLANGIVEQTTRALVLTSEKKHDSQTELVPLPNATAEAAFIIDWLRKRIERGTRPSEIAILARSSRSLETIELALKFQKIAYRKYGGLTLGDSAEVKDFISFLRLAFNPDDRVAMVRCLTQFPGVGESSAEKFVSVDDNSADDLFAVERSLPKGAGNLNGWLDRIRAARGLGEKGEQLLNVIYPLIERNYPQNGGERMATLKNLVDSMKAMSAGMEEFLDAFSLEKSTETEHLDSELSVATIHASKGLEFDCVILCGAGGLQMPHPRSTDPEAYEEERRLMYVAVTRARRQLLITYPVDGLPGSPQGPSPFFPDKFPWDAQGRFPEPARPRVGIMGR